MKAHGLLISLLVFFGATAYAQNVSTSSLEWSSVVTFDAQNGMLIDENTKLISSPTQITWFDASGAIKYDFTVSVIEGTWTNVSQNGTITFHVFNENDKGIVQFTKANGVIKVIIHFMLQDGKSIYELKVNNVNVQI